MNQTLNPKLCTPKSQSFTTCANQEQQTGGKKELNPNRDAQHTPKKREKVVEVTYFPNVI